MQTDSLLLLLLLLFAAETLVQCAPIVTYDAAFVQCRLHPMCRELYRVSEYMTPVLFEERAKLFMEGPVVLLPTEETTRALLIRGTSGDETITEATALDYRTALVDMEMKLVLARLIIGKLAFDDRRCPPNMYWRWNEATSLGHCHCFFDRNCDVEAQELGHDNVHIILLMMLFTVAILIVISIIVRMVYDPDLYKVKSK